MISSESDLTFIVLHVVNRSCADIFRVLGVEMLNVCVRGWFIYGM